MLWYVAAKDALGGFEDPVQISYTDDDPYSMDSDIPGKIYAADFTNDGYDDLFVMDTNGTGYANYVASPGNTGKSVFSQKEHDTIIDLTEQLGASVGYEDVTIADFDGNGYLDVAMIGLGSDFSTSYLPNGEGGEVSTDVTESFS